MAEAMEQHFEHAFLLSEAMTVFTHLAVHSKENVFNMRDAGGVSWTLRAMKHHGAHGANSSELARNVPGRRHHCGGTECRVISA